MITQLLSLLCLGLLYKLEVEAEIRQKEHIVLQSKQVTNVDVLVSSRSLVRCADLCFIAGNCTSATYNSSNKECFLSADGPMNIIDAIDNNVVTILVKGTSFGDQFGKSFLTGFVSNSPDNVGTTNLLMVSTVPGPTNVSITIPYLDIYKEQQVLDGFLYLQYNASLMPDPTSTVSLKGVEILSDQNIALYSLNNYSFSVGGTLEMPIEKWGFQYIIGTHNSSWWGTGQILVVAAENNTDVLFEFPTEPSIPVVLNKYETYQFLGNITVAGTIVSANKPISVHAGHLCANIPDHDTVFCDLIVENMPPISTLGSVFVVPYPRTRPMYTMGISAPHDVTTVQIRKTNGDILDTVEMNKHDSILRNFYASEILSITSSQNILVTQYGHGSSNTYGDPSLTTIPAITQFITRCHFAIPTDFDDPSVVAIIIDSLFDLMGFQLNGSPIVPAESASVFIPDIGTFDVVYINVSSNVVYSLYHNDVNVKFGAILYVRSSFAEFTTVLG